MVVWIEEPPDKASKFDLTAFWRKPDDDPDCFVPNEQRWVETTKTTLTGDVSCEALSPCKR
jgi:hypothetical protein